MRPIIEQQAVEADLLAPMPCGHPKVRWIDAPGDHFCGVGCLHGYCLDCRALETALAAFRERAAVEADSVPCGPQQAVTKAEIMRRLRALPLTEKVTP
jgi:hypothetical protein